LNIKTISIKKRYKVFSIKKKKLRPKQGTLLV